MANGLCQEHPELDSFAKGAKGAGAVEVRRGCLVCTDDTLTEDIRYGIG